TSRQWSLFRGPTMKKKVVAARVAVKALVVREVEVLGQPFSYCPLAIKACNGRAARRSPRRPHLRTLRHGDRSGALDPAVLLRYLPGQGASRGVAASMTR